jgi:hypothetical protein
MPSHSAPSDHELPSTRIWATCDHVNDAASSRTDCIWPSFDGIERQRSPLQARGRWFEPSCAHPGQSVAGRLPGLWRLVMTGLEGAGSQAASAAVAQVASLPGCDPGVFVLVMGAQMGAGFLRCPAVRLCGSASPRCSGSYCGQDQPRLSRARARSADWVGRVPGGAGAVMGAQTRVGRLRRLLERGRFSAEH